MPNSGETVVVLGSGPIRIGQGIEFDYSSVHCVWALQELGYRTVIINNNPETVSTDFDTADALYFEPVTLGDVLRIVRHERASGVVVQFGGQTAINLAQGLHDAGIHLYGTSADSIAMAEDRDRFEKLLRELDIPKPQGRAVVSLMEAEKVADEIGYPVLVRPSFVLGGRAMEIVYSKDRLDEFYTEADLANPGMPVLLDRYIRGGEAEVDVICDGTETFVPGIMEHIERAGVHSGDSMAVYPPISLSQNVQAQLVEQACELAVALKVKGLMNAQFVIDDERVLVLEVNPRASRTVPYLSKVTSVPMIQVATRCMMGISLREQGYRSGLLIHDERGERIASPEQIRKEDPSETPRLYAVKAPVFSFQKLARVEPSLGPEMKSTGEILGIDRTFEEALFKALLAAGIRPRKDGYVVLSVNDADKADAILLGRKLMAQGYKIAATGGTHDALAVAGVKCIWMMKISEGTPSLLDHIMRGDIALMINTPSDDAQSELEASKIRRACIETGIGCITNIDTAKALIDVLHLFENPSGASCLPIHEYAPTDATLTSSKIGVS